MKLAAALLLAMFPFAAAAWSALHWQAVGAADGVLWCVGLLAALVALAVVGAHLEPSDG
jgi:hypothetical protein